MSTHLFTWRMKSTPAAHQRATTCLAGSQRPSSLHPHFILMTLWVDLPILALQIREQRLIQNRVAGTRAAVSNLGLLLRACRSFFLHIEGHAPGSATSTCLTHLSLCAFHTYTHSSDLLRAIFALILAKDRYQTLDGWMNGWMDR